MTRFKAKAKRIEMEEEQRIPSTNNGESSNAKRATAMFDSLSQSSDQSPSFPRPHDPNTVKGNTSFESAAQSNNHLNTNKHRSEEYKYSPDNHTERNVINSLIESRKSLSITELMNQDVSLL